MPLADLIRTFNRADGLAPPPGSPVDAELVIAGKRAAARFDGLTLTSVFQPIVDLQKKRVVGHEALLRAHSPEGPAVTPGEVFHLPAANSDIVYLDRLTRTLHALNFLVQRQRAGGYLYLNVHPRHLTTLNSSHGLVFEAILKRCGLAPADIVLEVQESEIDEDGRLLEAIANYRQRGYVIAIDNFGRRHSNLDRLWRLQPEIVKIDRSLIVAATGDERAALVLAKLVEIVHALSAIAIAEGIETPGELKAARKAGADLVQGHLLGRPEPDCVPTHRRDEATFNLDLLETGAPA
jgi:EAL domain-containing protein (putative c-di-GMP-specific phosphodiesterase class I)